jgi:hypothetical protein
VLHPFNFHHVISESEMQQSIFAATSQLRERHDKEGNVDGAQKLGMENFRLVITLISIEVLRESATLWGDTA